MLKTLTVSRLATLTFISVAIFLLGVACVVGFNSWKDNSDSKKVRENLMSVVQAAKLYYGQNGEYTRSAMFIPAGSCTGAMFTDVASGLIGITGSSYVWPKNVEIICQADGLAYSVSALLPKPINGDGYWCVDSSGYNGPVRAHQAQGDVTC